MTNIRKCITTMENEFTEIQYVKIMTTQPKQTAFF